MLETFLSIFKPLLDMLKKVAYTTMVYLLGKRTSELEKAEEDVKQAKEAQARNNRVKSKPSSAKRDSLRQPKQ